MERLTQKQLSTKSLFEQEYNEILQWSRRQMQYERVDHTLSPTALVNEVYTRLVEANSNWWSSREEFRIAVANVKKQVLVDHARKLNTLKRGGGLNRKQLHDIPELKGLDLVIEIDIALRKLTPVEKQLVVLRFFAGHTEVESAELLGMSRRATQILWKKIKEKLSDILIQYAEPE